MPTPEILPQTRTLANLTEPHHDRTERSVQGVDHRIGGGVPPTLIAGRYGMNFKFMLEFDWAWGYPFELALILDSAVIPLV